MALPQFSELLVNRRRERGLSLSQISRVLKLPEDVLAAFEEGDYEHMPQIGYAQGALASYASHLNLDPREIVNLYLDELHDYQQGGSSDRTHRRNHRAQATHGSGYDTVGEDNSRRKAYVEYRPLLPTSGGPAGDMGDFATTAVVRQRTTMPPAGVGVATPGTRRAAYQGYAQTAGQRPYNARGTARSRQSTTANSSRRGSGASRRRYAEQQSGRRSAAYGAQRSRPSQQYRRDDVSTRRVQPSEYTDDMRYDDHPRPYSPASTLSGRRSSRNIVDVERPNVRRRTSSSSRSSSNASRGRRIQRQRGLRGVIAWFLSDSRRMISLLFVVLILVLTTIVLFSVNSCVNGKNQSTDKATQSVAVNATTETQDTTAATDTAKNDETEDSNAQDDSSEDSESLSDAQQSASDADDDSEQTVVEVSVASGSVSWLEITCDGTSEIADSVTGPWSGSYTVYDSITILTGAPDAVTVTLNGKRQEFPSKASGVGSLTIKGTPKPSDVTDSESSDSSDKTKSKQEDTSTSQQAQKKKTSTDTTSSSKQSSSTSSKKSTTKSKNQ